MEIVSQGFQEGTLIILIYKHLTVLFLYCTHKFDTFFARDIGHIVHRCSLKSDKLKKRTYLSIYCSFVWRANSILFHPRPCLLGYLHTRFFGSGICLNAQVPVIEDSLSTSGPVVFLNRPFGTCVYLRKFFFQINKSKNPKNFAYFFFILMFSITIKTYVCLLCS